MKRTMKRIIAPIFFGAAVLAFAGGVAHAGEATDKAVQKAMTERMRTFCKAVLPAWITTKDGMRDAGFRSTVTDCYLGHARLAMFGVETNLSLADTSLSEVPAKLLSLKTGMNLDFYRPLAGRTLTTRSK